LDTIAVSTTSAAPGSMFNSKIGCCYLCPLPGCVISKARAILLQQLRPHRVAQAVTACSCSIMHTAAWSAPDVAPVRARQIKTAGIALSSCIFCFRSISGQQRRMTDAGSAGQATADARL
jgi:hypothetical protein